MTATETVCQVAQVAAESSPAASKEAPKALAAGGYRAKEAAPVAQKPKVRAGILCFRDAPPAAPPAGDGSASFEVLLVSRRSKKFPRLRSCSSLASSAKGESDDTFTVPAGKFEADKDGSFEDCAIREAREEAGIQGKRVADLGWFGSQSKHGEPIQTRYFVARFESELETWLEDAERDRVWMQPSLALARASYRKDLADVVAQGIEAIERLLRLDAEGRPGVISSPQESCGEAPQQTCARTESNQSGQSEGAASEKRQPGQEEERFVFYQHQVGGHLCLVKPVAGCQLEVEPQGGAGVGACPTESYAVQGSRVLLKPFDEAEFRFYTQLRQSRAMLLPFTPRFYGSKTLRREQIGNLRASQDTAAALRETSQETETSTPPLSPDGSPRKKAAALLDDKAAFWMTRWSSHNVRKYIVLEDLSYKVTKPCIMDLKMGCRQRSARHSPVKRLKMVAKAELTTSAALGFRMCGMQCYDAETGTLKFYDKYWGQRITLDAMSQALSLFLLGDLQGEPDPCRRELWEDLLRKMIEMLGRLRRVVQELNGLRFWSGSLLLGFDAAHFEGNRREELLDSVQLKMIDFAHFADVGGDRPDEEYLCGVDNFRAHLEAQLQGSAVDAQWLSSRLVPPPPAAQHDEEEQRVFNKLRQASKEAPQCYATVSGSTGPEMARELASHNIERPQRALPVAAYGRGGLLGPEAL